MKTFIFALLFVSSQAFALEQIIHPYQSLRSAGMGGVKLTTGLYDENFFGNPARTLNNPKFRFVLLDFQGEATGKTIDAVKTVSGSGDVLQKLGSTQGNDNHGRVELGLLQFYFPPGEESKTGIAFGITESTQFDIDLRRSYNLSPQALVDTAFNFSFARKFMENDELGVGVNMRGLYRLASNPNYSFVDLIKGTSISPAQSGGDGLNLDFDLGGTYKLPFTYWDFDFTAGATIGNIFGGRYNLGRNIVLKTSSPPPVQPRNYGFGIVAHNAAWKALTDTNVALEFTDIGNNPDGSFFRLLHIGAETHYGLLSPRLGISQGYWAAGLGADLRFLLIDLATYGEEMSLNVGGLEDRRYAVRLMFKI